MTEKNAELRVNFSDRDFVGFCHSAKGCLDLSVNREKSFRNGLPGDTKVRRDGDIRYVVTPQFPELEPFLMCQHRVRQLKRVDNIKLDGG